MGNGFNDLHLQLVGNLCRFYAVLGVELASELKFFNLSMTISFILDHMLNMADSF